MKNICVIFGGQSIEHDVSIITGVLTVNSIDKKNFNAIPVYIHTNGKMYTGEQLLDLDNYCKLNVKKLKKVQFEIGDNLLYFNKKGKLKEKLFFPKENGLTKPMVKFIVKVSLLLILLLRSYRIL